MAHSGEALTAASPAGVMRCGEVKDCRRYRARHRARGDSATGEKPSSEQDIADRFGVNRHTVRRALAELTERGLVRAERGSGNPMSSPARITYPIRTRTRFSEIINASGRMAGGRLLASSKEPAPRDIALRLDPPPNTMAIRLEILRSANRVPISLGTEAGFQRTLLRMPPRFTGWYARSAAVGAYRLSGLQTTGHTRVSGGCRGRDSCRKSCNSHRPPADCRR